MSFVDTAKDLLRPILPGRMRYAIRKLLNLRLHKLSSVEYWTRHNVTEHRQFTSAEESLNFFDWRNAQYPGYIELVPVNQADGKVEVTQPAMDDSLKDGDVVYVKESLF